jgi:hypothetical protein
MNPLERGLRYLAQRGQFPVYQPARAQGEMSGWGFATYGHTTTDVSVTMHEAVTNAFLDLAEVARDESLKLLERSQSEDDIVVEIDALVKELRNQDHIAGWGGGRSRDA